MSNIISVGIGLPFFRIEDITLHPQLGKKGAMRSVCFPDQDVITLAFEASLSCLGAIEATIDGIFFATSTPAFNQRYHASFLADLLNLPQGILALDFINSRRSGTDALLLANSLIDSGAYKNILIIASDVHFPAIGKEVTTPFGHASCAILLGNTNGIAEISNAKSYSSTLAEEFSYKLNELQNDPRFSRDAGFKNNLTFALKNFSSDAKTVDTVILHSLYAKLATSIFSDAGYEGTQLAKDTLTSKIGNTGSAHALLLLALELENGKKNILLADYANGINIFEIKTHFIPTQKPLEEQLKKYEVVATYQDYLLLRKAGNFNSIKYKTKEIFSSEMMQEREKEALLYLKGWKCETCGTTYYLKSARCKKCKETVFTAVQLKNTGTVYSCTAEHYFPASFAPITMVVIDLDEGGRITVQQTDTMFPEKNKMDIGVKVKLVLRKMMENDAKPNYFWKAIPRYE